MWTSENRGRYDRSKLRYPSDLTDAEWALVAPLIPAAKRGGNKRTVNLREVANGLMYILSTGCQWARSPRTCRRAAPCTTTSTDGTTTARSGAFTTRSMWHAGSWRGETPARALRSSIARASRAQKRGRRIDPPGYDGGKKIRGKKRHVLVDTQGLLLQAIVQAIVHAADIQDREGGVLLMATLFGLYPFLLKLYADGGYQGPQFQGGLRRIMRQVDVQIVKRSDTAKGFTVLPKRWIVERTSAWLNRCRPLAKDWECLNRKALASCVSRPSASCCESYVKPANDPGWTLRVCPGYAQTEPAKCRNGASGDRVARIQPEGSIFNNLANSGNFVNLNIINRLAYPCTNVPPTAPP